jgi:lipoprotein-anchoring transpeptidase ErfK/SrfK
MRLRIVAFAALVLALTGCGSSSKKVGASAKTAAVTTTTKKRPPSCTPGLQRLGSKSEAYAAVVQRPVHAYRRPDHAPFARFGLKNVNGISTVFGVIGVVVNRSCDPTWYHVQLPIRPNGVTGYVRAASLWVTTVRTRIEVDVSARRLTFFRSGRPVVSAPIAVGESRTPTPTGRFYVNQELIPYDTHGPFGPGAIGISAFSNVLTGWTQGGPVAIHGTNDPSSIGRAVSNGCIRLANPVLLRIFRATKTGTPVVVHP